VKNVPDSSVLGKCSELGERIAAQLIQKTVSK
jgi:hypothetical protein